MGYMRYTTEPARINVLRLDTTDDLRLLMLDIKGGHLKIKDLDEDIATTAHLNEAGTAIIVNSYTMQGNAIPRRIVSEFDFLIWNQSKLAVIVPSWEGAKFDTKDIPECLLLPVLIEAKNHEKPDWV